LLADALTFASAERFFKNIHYRESSVLSRSKGKRALVMLSVPVAINNQQDIFESRHKSKTVKTLRR
jgi:hypothetical protein